MKNLVIRHATINDIPAILQLMIQLGYLTSKEELKTRFESFIKNEGYGVVVACLNTKVTGWIAWSKSSFFVYSKTRFHIEGLIVDKLYRGHSIGRSL